jgi:sugar/nucleoside kinase (ribokinase family)
VFVAAGSRAESFCRWVGRLGESSSVLDETLPGDLSLLHLEARALLGTSLRKTLDAAREQGALISIDLGTAEWIRSRGASKTAYQLATIQPDILFAGQDSAAELGAPLEGLATVPVLTLGVAGCAVYGRRVAAPAVETLDPDALMAAFCVAFVEGSAPAEAAGRAVLVAASRE